MTLLSNCEKYIDAYPAKYRIRYMAILNNWTVYLLSSTKNYIRYMAPLNNLKV